MRRLLSVAVAAVFLVGTGVAFASPRPLPLHDGLIDEGEFAGLRPEPETHVFSTANAWVTSGPHPTVGQMSAEIARLHGEGFVAALTEFLDRGSERGSGLSWVMQLGSAVSARAELQASLSENKTLTIATGGSFSAFSIPAIPGARGYRVSGGGTVGENVFFTDGPFLYLVGQGWSTVDKPPPTRADLIAATTRLYARVHRHPAG
jgi:hypothetical protein